MLKYIFATIFVLLAWALALVFQPIVPIWTAVVATIVIVGGLIAFHFVAIATQRLIRTTLFGWVDRACGAMIGLLAAMIVASVLTSVALELPVSDRVHSSVARSSVAAFVQPIAGWLIHRMFPRDPGRLATEAAARADTPDA